MSHSDFLFPRDISCPLTELLFCRTAGTWQRTDLNKHRLGLCCVQSCLCFYSIKGHGPSGRAIIYKQIRLVKPTLSFFIYLSKWCGIYHGMREILRIPGISVSHPLVSLLWFGIRWWLYCILCSCAYITASAWTPGLHAASRQHLHGFHLNSFSIRHQQLTQGLSVVQCCARHKVMGKTELQLASLLKATWMAKVFSCDLCNNLELLAW